MIGTCQVAALILIGPLSVALKPQDEPFPTLSKRTPHFYKKLSSPDENVRLRLLKEITYFNTRDSKVYPRYFRFLLNDPSPRIRWEAMHRLYEHGIYVKPEDLPETFEVPLLGLVDRTDEASRKELLDTAKHVHFADAGWAIHVLELMGEKDARPLAYELVGSANLFVRFSAAVALVHLGDAATGVPVLEKMMRSQAGNGYYRYRAAEVLVRMGKKEHLGTLVSMVEPWAKKGSATGPQQILEDLTGRFHRTPAEWKAWWDKKKKPAAVVPPDPPDPPKKPAVKPLKGTPYVKEKYRSQLLASSQNRHVWGIDPDETAWAHENTKSILDRDVTFVPHAGGGLKLITVRPGSIVAARGLLAGDVLKDINGKLARSVEVLRELLKKFPELRQSTLRLTIERSGKRLVVEYRPLPKGRKRR